MSELTTEKIEQLHEDVIEKHSMFPFWVFADVWKHNKGHFWCFLGAHYPSGLVSEVVQDYNDALEELNSGRYLLYERSSDPDKKIGYGYADTPSLAFIKACKMAGYMPEKK